MYQSNLISFLLILIFNLAHGQNDVTTKQPIVWSGVFSVGRSTFESNIPAPSKFPAVEFRVGMGLSKPLNKLLDMKSRLNIGVKWKRDSYINQGQVSGISPLFMGLDRLASNRNHYFIDIPLLLQFNFPHPALGVNMGINYRFFLPNNHAVDALTNRGEIGLMAGTTYRIGKWMGVGLDYTIGLTKIYQTSGTIDSSQVSLDVFNHFGQIRLEYFLKKSR